ncbi:MAG: bifunctional (p)ppGpp synthetase/guanosine-3',5'-bis(diphosphate) 3'-pyrophosphohydrolase [Chthonomonas sp.]|nr:bifunctional (p)ppGpp synthetase/guanosine-3',5'-bis(diphosphate) 3'-pyrophosphohydrolase [Chthonomonas sp.]
MASPYEISHTWEEPDGLTELLNDIRQQRPDADVRKIRYAYFIAEDAHSGQTRATGDPYITHPLAVTNILAHLRMDDDTICAALLHDTVEDCKGITTEKIREDFGEEVAMLVEGVTKLSFKTLDENNERQKKAAETDRAAENLRKMLLAMAKDVRVMVIKLADRLHNMQTLEGHKDPAKRIRISQETLDIFAPLAARLGIWQVKWQLEDLAFKFLHPKEYKEIQDMVVKTRTDREAELNEAIHIVKDELIKRGVKVVEVQGRPKHLFSIFNKIVIHGFRFEDILDLIAMRIVVASKDDCYVALGVVNGLWVPMQEHFADYIARPKPNGYQSLHIKVIGPRGEPLEIQIRTKEMHDVAEMGVAAHYAYKEGANAVDQRFANLRQQLFDWSSDYRTSSDFLRNLSTDLFSEQVFVFTPKGEVLDLPKNSTPVDFAFRVHTNLGLRLVGAKVGGQIVPLDHQLKNGDIVEVITRSNAQPSLDWLQFTASPSAKSKLRSYFRTRRRDENVAQGKELVERELKSRKLDPKLYLGEKLTGVIGQIKDCRTSEDIFAKVGEGLVSAISVVDKMRPPTQTKGERGPNKARETGVLSVVGGLDSVSMRRAKCCDPIPGEDVVGYVTRGRGIMIHRAACTNALAYEQSDPERLIPIDWKPDGSGVFRVNLKIVTLERQGLLADVSNMIAEARANIVGMKVRPLPNTTFEWDISVEVRDIEHLNFVLNKVSNLSDVFSILRVHGRTGSR